MPFQMRMPNLHVPSKVAFILCAISTRTYVDMTLDAPKMNATFEGKFGTLHQKDERAANVTSSTGRTRKVAGD